jgi:C-terminal processing protease CtpA/Prc
LLINELDRFLSKDHSFEESLKHFFNSVGLIEESGKKKNNKRVQDKIQLVDFSWFNDTIIPSIYSKQMQMLFDNYGFDKGNHVKLNNYYILDFKKEKDFNITNHTPTEERLQILFNYWNKIEYYWPNRHLLISNWDTILDFYIAKMLATNSASDIEMTMFGINCSLNDSHTLHTTSKFISTDVRGLHAIGVHYEIKDKRVFVDRIYNNDLKESEVLLVGDEILSCNKGSISAVYKKVKEYAPFSNSKFIDQLVQIELEYSLKKKHSYQIKRKGKVEEIQIKNKSFYVTDKPQEPIFLSKEMTYFKASHFPKYSIWDHKRKNYINLLLSADTVIIDLRDNSPHSFKGYFSKYLYEKGVYIDHLIPLKKVTKPGEYTKLKSEIHGGNKTKFNGLLVLLVNSNTGSIGEFTAMVLQHYKNCITVGTPTWGASGYSHSITAGYLIMSQYTVSAVYNSDKTLFNHSGIDINYIIDYNKQNNFEWDDDYILESAIRYLRNFK